MLLRAARREAARRGPRVQITGPELEDLAYQAAGDALLAITQKVTQFRGESRFTTWAYKFVIFEVSAKIARHFWRHPARPLDAESWDRLPGRFGFDPAQESEWRDLLAALRRAVDTKLARGRLPAQAGTPDHVAGTSTTVRSGNNSDKSERTVVLRPEPGHPGRAVRGVPR